MPFFRRKGKPKPELSDASVQKVRLKRTSDRSSSSPKTPLSADSFFNGDIGVSESVLTSRRPTELLLSNTGESSYFRGQLDSPMRTSSRLSKTLQEILHDRDAITCFLEFLESRKAEHLLKFWLDAESFQASSVLRLQSRSSKGKRSGISQKSQGNVSTAEVAARGTSAPGAQAALTDNSNVPKENACIAAGSEKQNNCSHTNHSQSEPEPAADESKHTCRTSSSSSSLENADLGRLSEISEPNSFKNVNPASSESDLSEVHGPDVASAVNSETLSAGCVTDVDDVCKERTSSSGSLETEARSESDGTESNVERKVKTGLTPEELQERLRKSVKRDAVIIFSKYISPDATHPIGVTEHLKNETIRRICREDGEVDPASFADCQKFVVEKMNKEHYQDFLDSEYHCKHQVDVLTGGKVYLADFLYNKFALSYFMEFVEQNGGSNLLQFWLAADNFQQHLISQQCKYDGMQAQNDAMILYDKYFSLQATDPLGFDDKTRFEVEGSICREGGPLPDCFAKPRDIVLHSLEKIHFPMFLRSEMYYKFLSDLVTTVEVAQDVPVRSKHKRQASDASSQHSVGSESVGAESIGSKNTLLAMNTQHIKKAAKSFGDEMKIDAMLLNPDELWKRPEAGPLTLGKVDPLGQFISEFDPEPDQDKKKGSARFFKNKKEKQREQEDMALKIAQMIISDVTTMTQTGDACAALFLSTEDSKQDISPSSQEQPETSHS